jgi:hypothetical protein
VTPESKDVSPIADSLIGDMAAVASAILRGGSEIASAASIGAAGLEDTPLAPGPSAWGDGTASLSSVLREVNGQIQQATGLVGGIVVDATSIVGSVFAAATSPSNIGVLPQVNSNSSTNQTSSRIGISQAVCTTCHSSYPAYSLNTTITNVPRASPAITSTTAQLRATPITPPCPAPITTTCTVTETWHSTHYAETATFYSFVANSTVTCTETVRYGIETISGNSSLTLSPCSICPPPPMYLPATTATVPPVQGPIACANGVLAKRQEYCPYMLNATSPLNVSKSVAVSASSPTSTNPCPNAGYTCSECPDGWFCPPHPTPAQSCVCGYGWACANCKDGYFCIPGPTSTVNGLINTVASILASSTESSIPVSTRSLTTSAPTLQSLGTAVSMPTGTVTCIDGSIVMGANDCLNDVPGTASNAVGITIINEPMAADLANRLVGDPAMSSTSATSLLEASSQLTAIAGFTSVAGTTLPTVTATNIIPTATVAISSEPNSFKHAPNAAESMLNQLMNGAPAGTPVSSASASQLPQQTPALGIARRQRRV